MIFQYKTKESGDIKVFHLFGELIDREQPKIMVDDVIETIEKGTVNILLNLKELRYINSSGLSVLINILTKSRKAGGDVAICCVNDKNQELLHITKLDSIFNVCASEEDAVALLNKQSV